MDMSNMNKMIALHGLLVFVLIQITRLYFLLLEADGDVVVQAGMPWEELNQTLKDQGVPLFFPVSLNT